MRDRTWWWPDIGAAMAVLFLGALEYTSNDWLSYFGPVRKLLFWLVVLGTALAVGLVRRAPGVSLVLVWAIPLCQAATGSPYVVTQISVLVVAFGTARWGGKVTLRASALSIPAAAVAAVLLVEAGAVRINFPIPSYDLIAATVDQLGIGWRIGVVVVMAALIGVPWLAGLALRISGQAHLDLAEAARQQAKAEQTARIRDAQTRLARDVHDVVGHSLAVILTQAEAAQYLPDDDPGALKSLLAGIATSARSSLRDVQEVLSTTRDTTDDIDRLIGNLRDGGREVVSGQDGTPRPLNQEQRVTAYRVLQEMLTNAIRHGRHDGAVIVQRSWTPDSLVIEVRNAIGSDFSPSGSGSGLDGMRQRLAAVGGSLESGRREDVFVATARIPTS
ncbi:sensor histidine kinase [Paractinoplanes atraurantiacus]|uniref:sensor histidine kinase n=1 Tax=Paractinoplanes atraurantiacus TaxID=1036182 RepID=UPI001177E5FA|nr:histidine kinase [Actinoplanes atraurantiacus]